MILRLSSVYKYKHIFQIYQYIVTDTNISFIICTLYTLLFPFLPELRELFIQIFSIIKFFTSLLLFQRLDFCNSFPSSKIQNHIFYRKWVLEKCIFINVYHISVFLLSRDVGIH